MIGPIAVPPLVSEAAGVRACLPSEAPQRAIECGA